MAKKKDKPVGEQRLFIKARHEFTAEEYKVSVRNLTRTSEMVQEAKDAKKTETAKRNAEIKQLESRLSELMNAVRNGGEDKDVEATVEFDSRKSQKTFRYHCPGDPKHSKVIRTEAMTPLDFEGLLPIDDDPKPPSEKHEGEEGGDGTQAQE